MATASRPGTSRHPDPPGGFAPAGPVGAEPRTETLPSLPQCAPLAGWAWRSRREQSCQRTSKSSTCPVRSDPNSDHHQRQRRSETLRRACFLSSHLGESEHAQARGHALKKRKILNGGRCPNQRLDRDRREGNTRSPVTPTRGTRGGGTGRVLLGQGAASVAGPGTASAASGGRGVRVACAAAAAAPPRGASTRVVARPASLPPWPRGREPEEPRGAWQRGRGGEGRPLLHARERAGHAHRCARWMCLTVPRAEDAAPAHGDAGGSSSNGDSQVTSEVTRRRGQSPCWLPLAFLPLACQQQTGPRPSRVRGFTTLKRLRNQGGSHFLNNVFSKMREECVKIQSHKKGTENPDIRPHRHNRPLFWGGGKVISGDPHRQVKVLHH